MDLFWERTGWEKEDRHYKLLKKMPFQRELPFIPEKDGLYIIRGPRQIGKTSWLKQILSHYSKKERCYYQSCEEIKEHKELGVLLSSLADRRIVLLDEITFVKDWDRAVKHAIDSGKTQILVITGSHAFDLKSGSDRMPGRFDGGGEYNLLPMDFFEFQEARKEAGWSSKNELEELKAYFRVGGFPIAVAEAGRKAILTDKTLDTYWKWLAGDVVALGKRESYLKEMLIEIARVMSTSVSLNNFSANTSFGSHNTVSEYLEMLEACFAVRTLLAIDLDSGVPRHKKNRKIYFTDPMIYWLALRKAGIAATKASEAAIAELVAHESLARRFDRFGYFSNKNGEVDFVRAGKWALEVKWSAVATNLSKSYHSLVVPWKQVWTQSNFLKDFPPN